MFTAQQILETYNTEYRAASGNGPYNTDKSHPAFGRATFAADKEAIAQTRIYKFPDGSILMTQTDINGYHYLEASIKLLA